MDNTESDSQKSICKFRQESFLDFVSSLPRICSPTLCGIINHEIDPSNIEPSNCLQDKSFNWSIDQMSELKPCEFSNYDEIELFREIEEEHLSNDLRYESELFFSQPKIIPSPVIHHESASPNADILKTPVKTRNTSSFVNFISNLCKSTSDQRLNTHSKRSITMYSVEKTPQNRFNRSSNLRKRLVFGDDNKSCSMETSKQFNKINCSVLFSPVLSPNFPKEAALFSPILKFNPSNLVNIVFDENDEIGSDFKAEDNGSFRDIEIGPTANDKVNDNEKGNTDSEFSRSQIEMMSIDSLSQTQCTPKSSRKHRLTFTDLFISSTPC